MRKLLVLLLAVAMIAIAVIGCAPAAQDAADEPEADKPEADKPAADKPAADDAEDPIKVVTIGDYTFEVDTSIPLSEREFAVVYMNTTVPFAQAIKQGADAAAEEFGCNGYMTGKDQWDTAVEIEVVEGLIAKGVDGISIAVLDEPGMTPVIVDSLESGIPTTCFNVDAVNSPRLGFVGEDLFHAGAATAEDIVERMGEEGKVLISSVAQAATWSRQRQDGVESVLAKYPGIEVVQVVDCPGSEQEAYTALENAFLANQDIDAHISLGGTSYLFGRIMQDNSTNNAFSETDPIYNTGHDLTPAEEKLQMIVDGWVASAFTQNPYKQGYEAIAMFAKFYQTGDPSVFEVMDTGVECVDATNIQEYIDKLDAGEPVG